MRTHKFCAAAAIAAFGCTVFPAVALASEPGTHDGFFFQGSFGLGRGWLDEETSGPGSTEEASSSGTTVKFEVLFGGTPASGLVLGGGLTGHSIMDPTIEYEGDEIETEDTYFRISQVSLFSHFYPDPRGGFYLHGSLGYASASVEVDGTTMDTDTGGPVLGLGAGYDFWVGEEWSIGPQFRFTYAHLTGEDGDVEATSNFISPTIAFSGTFH